MAEGKKPDAAEWAPKFVTSYYSLGVDEVTPLLADFQRETLLWAAQQFMESPDLDWHAYEVAELLERLAEGRQL